MRIWFSILLICNIGWTDFTLEHPELKKHLFVEPTSNFYFGLGIAPLGVLKNRAILELNIFQLHYLSHVFDIECVSASVGFGLINSASFTGSRLLMVRSSPKVRLLSFFSVGPVIGYELVSFGNVLAHATGTKFKTPTDSFSAAGLIYGITLSQVFPMGGGLLFKINESFLQETYQTDKNSSGWVYTFDNSEIQGDPSHALIKASYLALVEVSLLF